MKNINYLFNPSKKSLKSFCKDSNKVLQPFSEDSLSLIQTLSSIFLKDKKFTNFPELVALGYWLRRSNLQRMKKSLIDDTGTIFAPRGIGFHIAPGNVDTIFVYSIAISLLMGNMNIVRLSSKESEQKDLLIAAFKIAKKKLPNNLSLQNTLLLSYEYDDDVSNFISLNSDLRVIWGGDETVRYFSNLRSSPTSIDIKFANKYSLSVIDLESLQALDSKQLNDLANKFVNDSYSFGQQGCSSPRAICWVGEKKYASRICEFWSLVEEIARTFNHDLKQADYIEKLIYLCSKSINSTYSINKESSSPLVTILDVKIDELIDKNMHCGRGTFLQSYVNQLDDITPYINRSVQTISYFGLSKEKLLSWSSNQCKGIDRIVPIGQSLNFDYIWDGVNIFHSVSRIIDIK